MWPRLYGRKEYFTPVNSLLPKKLKIWKWGGRRSIVKLTTTPRHSSQLPEGGGGWGFVVKLGVCL